MNRCRTYGCWQGYPPSCHSTARYGSGNPLSCSPKSYAVHLMSRYASGEGALPGVKRESELRERLKAILSATPPLMRVLSVARRLCLPDWLVFSGAVYQPVLNHLTGRPLDYGIKDYDLGYFDASNLSYEAEDAVIRRVKAAFDEPLRSMVEVRNQARVHLWFEAKFGEAYGPLKPPSRRSVSCRWLR